MPYVERTGKKTIKEQLYQWFGVMTDPRIDGFNGFACKQKIYEVFINPNENGVIKTMSCTMNYSDEEEEKDIQEAFERAELETI